MKVTSIYASSKTKYIWVLKNWHWHNFQTHCLLVHYAMFLYNPTTKFCGPDVSTLALYPLIIQKCPPDNKASWRRSIDVSLYVPGMSQVRLNKTPNDVSVELRQDVSVVRLHNVLLVCRDDISWGRNDNVPSVRLHDVSNKAQMKHPTTSQWYITKTSQWYISTTSH